ncbi:hypothetical protein CGU37_12375 [Pseudomonas fluorescens]|nr:hypothetical protein CGU36_13330 [Pseudomonas fluorescens]OZO48597.1 hypothetical protein CGU37_12375 [Pseudomonas fluorescens]
MQSIATNFHSPMEFSFSAHLFFTAARVDDHRRCLTGGSLNVHKVQAFRGVLFYWMTILFYNTLATALSIADWLEMWERACPRWRWTSQGCIS